SFFETNQRKINYRGNFTEDEKESPPDYEILLKNVTVFDLAKAFKKALESVKPVVFHEVKKLNVTLEEQIAYILAKLDEIHELHFLSLVDGMKEKIRIVITFVALLELTKMQTISIKESTNFNDFVIIKLNNGQDIQFNN
ncbi:MAG: segregation/condensation protein A, partial [Ignavibacteriaceae bacterium]|nr:segregation/condensation protein A [Ignavibacteriaceae bacterium]